MKATPQAAAATPHQASKTELTRLPTFDFLGFPRELRDLTYSFYIATETLTTLRYQFGVARRLRRTSTRIFPLTYKHALFFVNRQVHHEYLQALAEHEGTRVLLELRVYDRLRPNTPIQFQVPRVVMDHILWVGAIIVYEPARMSCDSEPCMMRAFKGEFFPPFDRFLAGHSKVTRFRLRCAVSLPFPYPHQDCCHSEVEHLLVEMFDSKVLSMPTLKAASVFTTFYGCNLNDRVEEHVKDEVDDGETWEVLGNPAVDECWQEMLKVNGQKQRTERSKKRKLRVW
ncbi:hypothetical protein LTS18_006053 [Coniosporium uncinatum]|uniref:Uncharacterized protein n=1 Tax=Coniosporium uncinatum TaxID=93489 RepID=A0ACC3DQM0_9PEZI|nr:hypothetical protein LTS18_006053 [Coniosporium uncinatum]